MTRLLRAELRKVFTTKLWWGMLLGAVGFAALGVVGQIASNGTTGNPTPPLSSPETQRSIVSSASSGYLFSIIVGIILMTTEFRHFTSRPTFLIEPRRGRVIISKLVVAAGLGVAYGGACATLTGAIVPFVKQVYKSLPGAAAQALIGAGGGRRGAPDLLDPLQGGLLLLAWGLALTASG